MISGLLNKLTMFLLKVSDLISKVSAYKPKYNRYRILLVGPAGYGKTSFINTVNNALSGRVAELSTARFNVDTVTHKV